MLSGNDFTNPRRGHSMSKFSWRTKIIFDMILLLGVILLGLGTAYVSELKQQNRQLSDNSLFNCGAPVDFSMC